MWGRVYRWEETADEIPIGLAPLSQGQQHAVNLYMMSYSFALQRRDKHKHVHGHKLYKVWLCHMHVIFWPQWEHQGVSRSLNRLCFYFLCWRILTVSQKEIKLIWPNFLFTFTRHHLCPNLWLQKDSQYFVGLV